MNYKVAKRVYKDYNKLPIHIKVMALEQLESLETTESLSELSNVIHLKGTDKPYFRMKFNDYRFILYYDIETDTVDVLSLTHRKDTYKKQNLHWRR